jgi:molybdopterin-synthase adenylyltransferase
LLDRYKRNVKTLSEEENDKLKDCKVCVIGCGGLGGYVIEMLGRLGIGHITAVDGDVFDETNLNRQILSDEESLRQNKAEKAKERMKLVNSTIQIKAISEMFTRSNGKKNNCRT